MGSLGFCEVPESSVRAVVTEPHVPELASRGAALKFLQEIRMVDEDEEAAEVRETAANELERLTARMGTRGRTLRVES
jgi:hypothetical protein